MRPVIAPELVPIEDLDRACRDRVCARDAAADDDDGFAAILGVRKILRAGCIVRASSRGPSENQGNRCSRREICSKSYTLAPKSRDR